MVEPVKQVSETAGFHDSKWRASGTQLAAKTEHSEFQYLEVYRCPKYDACG